MTTHEHIELEQKKILQIYGVLGASLVLSFIPSMMAALASLVFFTGVLIAAYVMRGRAGEDSLTANHMSFIIRTIWIGSFLAMITIGIGSAYMLAYIDNAPFQPCIDRLMNMGMAAADTNTLMQMFEPCTDEFVRVNLITLIIAGTICAGPVLLYFIVRYVRGLRRAMGGYRLANPKSWF